MIIMMAIHMLNDDDHAVGEMTRRRVVEERQRKQAWRRVEQERQTEIDKDGTGPQQRFPGV